MRDEFSGHRGRTLDSREARAVERSVFGPHASSRDASDACGRRPVLSTPVDLSTIDAYFAAKERQARESDGEEPEKREQDAER